MVLPTTVPAVSPPDTHYDIADDRRRTRLHKRLLDFGSPVQYSVFECLLEPQGVSDMKRVILRTISKRRDQVRIYAICGACARRIWVSAGRETVGADGEDLFV